MKLLLSGNEAIALAAKDAGVRFAAAYPGTPSTEILETIAAKCPEIEAQWSVNEKVAFETGIGTSLAGARTLIAPRSRC
jgi:indolepyruvate ferredoxin oxidoreductase alpha subunit